ncbi:MAG: hypothetical protein ACPGSD_04400 [Flavobacteriales bacterium]
MKLYYLIFMLSIFSCGVFQSTKKVFLLSEEDRTNRTQIVDSLLSQFSIIEDSKNIEPAVLKNWGDKEIDYIKLKTSQDYRLFEVLTKENKNYEIYVLYSKSELMAIKEGSRLDETEFFETHYFFDDYRYRATFTARGMRKVLTDEIVEHAKKLIDVY